MRSSFLVALLVAVPAAAFAGRRTAVISPSSVEAPCRALITVPMDARSLRPTTSATISAASCLADVRLRAVAMRPDAATAQALEAAIQESVGMLDAVIQTGDVSAQILAGHARADLYAAIAVRLASLAPPLGPDLAGYPLTQRLVIVAQLDNLARPYRDRARDGFDDVARLGSEHPELVDGDPVLAEVVTDSRFQRSTGIARR